MKKLKTIRFLSLMFLFLAGILILGMGRTKAASSYSDAKVFYDTVENSNSHCEVHEGDVYFATSAKVASSSSNLKYCTVGYDITLSGNGQSVSFGVKRMEAGSGESGSMKEVSGSQREVDGWIYNLYSIPAAELFRLARLSDATAANTVLSSSSIEVCIDAIMTTKQPNGTLGGTVTENGSGGLIVGGTVYHMENDSEWDAMKKIFSGHTFTSFRNIIDYLDNYQLSIRYDLNGGTPNAKGYDVETDEEKRDVLLQDKNPYTTSARILGELQLVSPDTIELKKTGYKLESGKEWKYNNRYFTYDTTYTPKEICSGVGSQDAKIFMTANWQPITYTVEYDNNGGDGIFAPQLMTYDKEYKLHGASTRKGYKFMGWKDKVSGTIYNAGESKKNLTDKDGATITLTAVWEPGIYKITTNKQGGSGGTDKFYEKYDTGWYSDEEAKTSIPESKIEIPTRKGYKFQGYWAGTQKAGDKIVNEKGKITAKSKRFSSNATIYAYWEPATYTITFDKQGGTGGTSTATATYKKGLPDAEAPTKKGYSFKGYYTKEVLEKIKEAKEKKKEYKPTGIYYDENMNGSGTYTVADDITLYAYWEDDIAPTVTISAEPVNWTNGSSNKKNYGVQCVRLNIEAIDDGIGLDSIILKDRNDTTVGTWSKLGGVKTYTCTYDHTKEGAVTYTVEVKDKNGNTAKAQAVAKYDVTKPWGYETENTVYDEVNGTLELEWFVSDYTAKN